MPILKLLAESFFLLFSFLDLEFTKRRLHELGVEAELNPAIRWLIGKSNIEVGTSLGIIIPTLSLAAVGWAVSPILYYMLGVRSLLFALQTRTR